MLDSGEAGKALAQIERSRERNRRWAIRRKAKRAALRAAQKAATWTPPTSAPKPPDKRPTERAARRAEASAALLAVIEAKGLGALASTPGRARPGPWPAPDRPAEKIRAADAERARYAKTMADYEAGLIVHPRHGTYVFEAGLALARQVMLQAWRRGYKVLPDGVVLNDRAQRLYAATAAITLGPRYARGEGKQRSVHFRISSLAAFCIWGPASLAPGAVVAFKDGDNTNFAHSNLTLTTVKAARNEREKRRRAAAHAQGVALYPSRPDAPVPRPRMARRNAPTLPFERAEDLRLLLDAGQISRMEAAERLGISWNAVRNFDLGLTGRFAASQAPTTDEKEQA